MTEETKPQPRWFEGESKERVRAAYDLIRRMFPEIPVEMAQGFAYDTAVVSWPSDPYSSAILQVHYLRTQLIDCAERYTKLGIVRDEAKRMEALLRAFEEGGGGRLTGVTPYPPETGS